MTAATVTTTSDSISTVSQSHTTVATKPTKPPMTHPRIGIGCLVLDSKNRFLIGKRLNSHGSNTYALPGGHLEIGESWEECAGRELEEETNLTTSDSNSNSLNSISNSNWYLTYVSNNVMTECNYHYVTLFMCLKLNSKSEEEDEVFRKMVINMEPHKCAGWEWISCEELWERYSEGGFKLFLPLELLIKAWKEGKYEWGKKIQG